MKRDHVNRRDFNKLTMAAMGGMMAGSLIGCGTKKTEKTEANSEEPDANAKGEENEETVAASWEGPHVCRGLNACKGKGKTGKNACVGQGECAIAQVQT